MFDKTVPRIEVPEVKVPPGVTVYREVPIRPPEPRADVAVPLAWSVISGGLVGALILAPTVKWGWSAVWVFFGGLGTTTLVWFALMINWRKLWFAFEEITGVDWDRNGHIGKPQPPRQVNLTITNPDEPNTIHYLNVPDPIYAKLPNVARALLTGKPFSEGAMCGTGRPLSRSEFHQLRDLFFDRGVCHWKDDRHHTLGVDFTIFGRGVIRQMAEMSTTPPRMRTPRVSGELPPPRVGE